MGKNPFDMVGGFVAGAAKAAADTAGGAVNAAAKAANDAGKVAGGVANVAGKAAGDAANAARTVSYTHLNCACALCAWLFASLQQPAFSIFLRVP